MPIGYHKLYTLSSTNDLVEEVPGPPPESGTVAALVAQLEEEHIALNDRLSSPQAYQAIQREPHTQAGIYPLKVTRFECLSEGDDGDGMCRRITERLGNLKIIEEVPFMRRGNLVFAIGSQGWVDSATHVASSVDAILGCRVLWKGTLTEDRYAYDLIMFNSGKDKSVARMSEYIDLTHRVGEIDPGVYQSEIAYHLEKEGSDHLGRPMLSRRLSEYGPEAEMDTVAACYLASADFSEAVRNRSDDVVRLAEVARLACLQVPRKRYYQAYDAFLQGIAYRPQ